MRTKYVAATIVAGTLFFASCKWFGTASNPNETKIVGKWTIDSLGVGKDSNKALMYIAMAMLTKDASREGIEFRTDSNYVQIPDTTKNGKYYLKEKELYLYEDTSFVPYHLKFVNDSTVHLTDKDSALIVLKKH